MLSCLQLIEREKHQRCAGITGNNIFFSIQLGNGESANGCIGLIPTVSSMKYFECGMVLLVGKRKSYFAERGAELLVGKSTHHYASVGKFEIGNRSIAQRT